MKKMIQLLTSFKAILVELALVLTVIIGVYHGGQVLTPPVDNTFGATPGDPFEGPITYTPRATTTTRNATITLSAGDMENFGVFNLQTASTQTITLPATSTFATFIKNPDARAEYTFNNNSEFEVIFTEGTGMDFEGAATSTGGRRIGPHDSGRLILQRHSTSTDVKALLTVYDD